MPVKLFQMPVKVVGVGDKNQLAIDGQQLDIQMIETTGLTQRENIQLVEDQNPDYDLYVLCQLTQPLREKGLLRRVIEQFERNRKTIISATLVRDTRWRVIDDQGRWGDKSGSDDKILLHDGVIYAWSRGHLGDIYDKDTPHDVIVSSETLPLVDIDYKEDMDILNGYSICHRTKV